MSKSLARMSAEEIGQELTERQRAFVDTYVSTGCSVQDAAIAAGYSPASVNGARSQGHQLLRKPHVQTYMYKRLTEELVGHAPKALGRLAKLSSSAKSEYVQLEASKDLLDRAGIRENTSAQQGAAKVEVIFDLSRREGESLSYEEGGSKTHRLVLDPHPDTRDKPEKLQVLTHEGGE